MRFVLGVLFFFLLLCTSTTARTYSIDQFGNWKTLIDNKTNRLAMCYQGNNAVISLHLIPEKQPYLTISLPQERHFITNQAYIQIKIDHSVFTLFKGNFPKDQGFDTFKMDIPSTKLKDFVHNLTANQSAFILIGSSMIPISLDGTTNSVKHILRYINQNQIEHIPAPFDSNIHKINQKPDQHFQEHQKNTSFLDNLPKPFGTYCLYLKMVFLYFFALIILLLLSKWIIRFIVKRKKEKQKQHAIAQALLLASNEIHSNGRTLRIKRIKRVYTDEYGKTIFSKWFRERDQFVSKCIKPMLQAAGLIDYYPLLHEKINTMIHQVAYDNTEIDMALTRVSQEIEKHHKVLYIKRKQLLYKDDYGAIIYDKWQKEINNFIKNCIRPVLMQDGLADYIPLISKEIIKQINNTAKSKPILLSETSNGIQYSPRMQPRNYELYCANLLQQIGWDAQTTVISGDQGADVIATKNHIRLILQCKLYNKPVGNKAVQEISTAKIFYHADHAAVVSNADYTVSAKQLASSANIILLHHEKLQDYAKNIEKKYLPHSDTTL